SRCSTIQDVAELSTIDPSTGACRSPITSSSVNSTAAIGVLNAAASAADAPIGTRSLMRAGLNPNRRPRTDAIPAPTCTDGPSRPRAIPLASESDEHPNYPSTVRKRISPPWINSAVLVCGMPLPRALGKRSEEHTSELQSRQYLVCRLLLEKNKKVQSQQVVHAKKKNIKPF